MAIRKFVAPTTREAMMQVRRELGDDAVIIANRRVGNRIEILAAAPDAVDALVERSEMRPATVQREPASLNERAASRAEPRPKVEAFQDFVRRQMQTDAEAPPQQRAAREVPARANAAPAQRGLAGTSGVAMYHDVADFEEEEFAAPQPRQTERVVQRAPAGPVAQRRAAMEKPAREREFENVGAQPARSAATTLPHSHRSHQVETVAQEADPAVFRRRPAHVAPVRAEKPAVIPTAAPRQAPPPVDILLEPQAAAQPAAQPAPQPAEQKPLVVAQPVPSVETREQGAPVASGHAPVPSLPLRSQAAPIATAARLREASINAAAEMTAAMQSPRGAAPAEAAPMPLQPAVIVTPTQPPRPTLATWSWEAQFADVPVPPVESQAPVMQPAVTQAPAAPVVEPIVQASTAAPVVQAPVVQAPVAQPPVAQPPAVQAAVVPVVVEPAAPMPVEQPAQVAEPARPPQMETQLLAELHSMHDMLRQQIATLAIKPAPEAAAPSAPSTRVKTRLLTAGFSAEVARRIATHVPHNLDVTQAESWLHELLAHNIRCAEPAEGIVERAGTPATPGQVVALVGPTGVGKTTTVAKLAARFAVRHGTSALGLITLDAYRVAAPEQLRTYGRILGTPVHLAQDLATLRALLATMVHKRLVLIDTCGVSQRDERLGQMLDLLANAGISNRPVQRVLLLNSASHAETLEETARAWRAQECTGAILTKLDEATRIGGALDVSLRHRLTLLGLTNGQRVPEDWHAANSKLLGHLALKPGAQLFDLADEEGAALVQAHVVNAAAHGATHA